MEREVVFDGVARIEAAQPSRDVEGHGPAGRAIAREADATRDRVDVGVERDHEVGRVHALPDAQIDSVPAHHPAQVEVEPLARAAVARRREEEAHARGGRQPAPWVQAAVVEGESALGERGERVGDLRRRGGPLQEESFHRSRLRAHLLQEQEKAGDVASIVEPVLEPAQEALRFPRVQAVDRLRGMLAQRLDDTRDAALDLLDVAVGQGRSDQADDLAVRIGGLLADELEGVGVDESMVVVRVEVVQAGSKLRDAHVGIVVAALAAIIFCTSEFRTRLLERTSHSAALSRPAPLLKCIHAVVRDLHAGDAARVQRTTARRS